MRPHRDGGAIDVSSIAEVLAVLDLVPRPNHFRQPVFVGPVAAVQVRVQAFHQGLVLLPDSRFIPILVRMQGRQRAPLGRRQSTASRIGGLAYFRSLVAQYLERVVDPVTLPRLLIEFRAFRTSLAVGPQSSLDFLFGLSLEKIPPQLVLADVLAAEPMVLIKLVWRFRSAEFALLLARRVLAFAR